MQGPQHTNPVEPRGYARAREKAAVLAGDVARVADLVARATRKAGPGTGPLGRVWDDLTTLLRFLKAWIRRTYTDISPRSLIAVIAAVVYFVNPFDIMPDFLPIVGYVDDATIIAFVIASVKNEIERFRAWELQHSPQPSPLP